MENTIPSAVLKDTRPKREQRKNYKHIAGSVPVVWKEIDPNIDLKVSQRFQSSSFSCVFQSKATALEKLTRNVMTALDYFWRSNYPYQGSSLANMADILKKRYTAEESLYPSQNMSEAEMNQKKELKTHIGISGYAYPAFKRIDQIAEAIEAYKHCILSFGAGNSEWLLTPIYKGGEPDFYHAICGVAYGLINGVKTIICMDSAGQWSSSTGRRFITENFLVARATGAVYFNGFIDYSIPEQPIRHIVTTPYATINTYGTRYFWESFLTLNSIR